MPFHYVARSAEAGMVLLISLTFLLLLTLIGLSAMQMATSQEKITGSILQRNQSFQSAESGLRMGESAVQATNFNLPPCHSIVVCAPPGESISVNGPGVNPISTITWVAMKGGLYGIQNLGLGVGPAHLPADTSATLYRVTSVGISGHSRSVLESVYARVGEAPGERFRRILWRQLQ